MRHGAVTSTAEVGPRIHTAVTPSGTISLDVTLGVSYGWTAGENETVNASGTQIAGQEITCIIGNDGVLPRTITFGTGFKPLGTIIGTTTKTAVIKFVSDGTNLWEVARSLAL
jgi:hypothetical protein